MVRITFSNWGVINQMFFDVTEKEAIESFWNVYSSTPAQRNSGGIKLIHVGSATDTNDTGGFSVGSKYREVA